MAAAWCVTARCSGAVAAGASAAAAGVCGLRLSQEGATGAMSASGVATGAKPSQRSAFLMASAVCGLSRCGSISLIRGRPAHSTRMARIQVGTPSMGAWSSTSAAMTVPAPWGRLAGQGV